MVRKILTYGDPVLRKTSEDVPKGTDIKDLSKDLWDTLNSSPNGVGLAAPQIGVNKKVFVVDDKNGFRQTFVNPLMVEEYGEPMVFEEGCLSLPGLHFGIIRLENIKMMYEDEKGSVFIKHFTGLLARIIQHEYDHLLGKLWIDCIPQEYQMKMLSELIKLKKL